MGKRQHQKDKMYLTCTEWSTLYGGKRASEKFGDKAKFRRLPFHCCSLSLQPFEHPYTTKDGIIFDLTNIIPFLKKFGINPVTGEKLSAKDLIKLKFHKNASGNYHCPVTFKVFNENSHIVAVLTTGNVFSYEAVERLNIKPGFWKDLLTDEPFSRKDLITILDPTNLKKFNLAEFYHLKKNLKVTDEEDELARKDPRYTLKAVNLETREALDELDREYKAPEKQVKDIKRADSINAAHYSTGRVAASFTSTAVEVETTQEAAIINEDLLRYERIKKKAYIKLITNKGAINVELHSDMVPRVCENFLKHCVNGYYNDTIFHRSIRNFMIQGGDPEGTGSGGQSIWGKPFKDEFKPNLTHTGRGVLSMANTGPDTNKSQFFITYRSCRHLDGKHTVFGRVVGGIDCLSLMEKVPTDKNDRPKEEIKLLSTIVFVNPYDEVDEMLVGEREDAKVKKIEAEAAKKVKAVRPSDNAPKVYRQGVGKYINVNVQKRTIDDSPVPDAAKKSKKTGKSGFGDFSAW